MNFRVEKFEFVEVLQSANNQSPVAARQMWVCDRVCEVVAEIIIKSIFVAG